MVVKVQDNTIFDTTIKTTDLKRIKLKNWKNYGIEFLSIFIAVIAAFALNNWNDNRKNDISENKILMEIANGLEKDLSDIRHNMYGHEMGMKACGYFSDIFTGKEVNPDSLMSHYFSLTRDFVCIQNVAGYETLKSKGLELVKNDSLRHEIISLYEYDYTVLRKLEEEYSEMQFHESYFKEINAELAPYFKLDSTQRLAGLNLPLDIEDSQKKKMLVYLWKIEVNRSFTLDFYAQIEQKIMRARENIALEIEG